MPRTYPTTPSKPVHPRGTFAKHPSTRASGKDGVRASFPPRMRNGVVKDEKDGPSIDEAIQETLDRLKKDGGIDEADKEEIRNGIVLEPEKISHSSPPPSDAGPPRRNRRSRDHPHPHPQKSISKMWKNFDPDYLGRVTRILPQTTASSSTSISKIQRSQNASESYQQARAACEETVRKIVEECRAVNQKYSDVHFDLERDLKITQKRDCIDGLIQDDADRDDPADVKRVTDLFENPRFFSDGAGFDDIIQGAIGDCWMMSAFSVISSSEDLIRRICVVQDQDVGVYGFVFFRDGEWLPTIIDDKLYLRTLAYDESIETSLAQWGKDAEQKYNEIFQRGSKALYFASCRDDNETWVPLLEKAFAKAHGGYDALRGGQTGECIEDMTGGVTTELYTTNILNKDQFWSEELRKIGKGFMFDATDAMYREWRYWDEDQAWVKQIRNKHRKGVQARHAYAVLDTYEGDGERLVKVRNPWGETEWDGPWSDGSPQWTAQWLEKLDHKFGDDGVFWMSYKDFLNHYKHINRTRIFDESWYTAQKWATVQVPFSAVDYQQTKFQIDIPEDTETVIMLSQLDDRYFAGLEGKYAFQLQFRISRSENEDEYIARSRPNYELQRSTNVELKLKKGLYTVLIKIEATDWSPWGKKTPEEVIKANLPHRKEKVTTIGRLYDLAHQKGMHEDDEPPLDPTTAVMPPATALEIASAEMATSSSSVYSSDSDSDSSSDSSSESEAERPNIRKKPSRRNPWNASCVVGLRVYSKQPDLTVKVIWPPLKQSKKTQVVPQLDRDAITKAPQDAANKDASPVEEKKAEREEKNGTAVETETQTETETGTQTEDKAEAETGKEPAQGVLEKITDGIASLVPNGEKKTEKETETEKEKEDGETKEAVTSQE